MIIEINNNIKIQKTTLYVLDLCTLLLLPFPLYAHYINLILSILRVSMYTTPTSIVMFSEKFYLNFTQAGQNCGGSLPALHPTTASI